MLRLAVHGSREALAEIGRALEERGALRHVALPPGLRPGECRLTAELAPRSADAVLGYLAERGVPEDAITITRADDVGPLGDRRGAATLVWTDVVGQATANARPVGRFLVFMLTAGVIAAFGVINVNGILVVGAMAVSPDALPIAAACVGLVSARWRLAALATVTLVLGLGAATLVACAVTFALNAFGELPHGFDIDETGLSGLTTVNVTTVAVALAAGIAGMLALETRASAAVGVAISVTTIPAAAYLGVAAGLGEIDEARGAGAVLAVNVAMLLVGGIVTLLTQRRLQGGPDRLAEGATPPRTAGAGRADAGRGR
jgi:uncharacterized hydrophobic protein (TIGR00271 family)